MTLHKSRHARAPAHRRCTTRPRSNCTALKRNNGHDSRKRLDIGWRDLLFGMAQCLAVDKRAEIHAACQESTAAPDQGLFFLSVRSGFDAYLQAAQFPPGSHILVSAITIPDMLEIIRAHDLVPVPVDLDPLTLQPDPDSLEGGLTDKTVALLATHLFGARIPVDPLVRFARRNGLVLLEDCAQAYWGDGFTGHPASQVRMFSFGPIKHNTALGGGLLFVGNALLREKVRRLQQGYPVQSKRQFFKRLAKYGIVVLLNKPGPYTVLCVLCRLMGKSHDIVCYGATRSFMGGGLLEKLRQQPCQALLSLLSRRLRSDALARTECRQRAAAAFRCHAPDLCCPGHGPQHSHWLFAVRVGNAEGLCQQLQAAGFDAHLWPPSLCVVPPDRDLHDQVPTEVLALQRQMLFLPVYAEMGQARLDLLSLLVRQWARSGDGRLCSSHLLKSPSGL